MQFQNVTGAVSNMCSAVGQTAYNSASWVGHKVSDWSHAAYDLLARISTATKHSLTVAWNYTSQGLRFGKSFLMAHRYEAALVGVTAGVCVGLFAMVNHLTRANPSNGAASSATV